MTNQSREAFEKWSRQYFSAGISHEMWPKSLEHSWEAAWEAAWQTALSEGRRLGIEEAAKVAEAIVDGYQHCEGGDIGGAIRALIVGGGEK